MPPDYLLLWSLTILNSFMVIVLIRHVARLPQRPPGPPVGLPVRDWTLRTVEGSERTGADMPSAYTLLVAAENCGACHGLLARLARSGRPPGTLVIATSGDGAKLAQAAESTEGPLYDEFLTGTDPEFMQKFRIPSTPYALAVRHGRVVASGPARTPEELAAIADVVSPGGPKGRDLTV